MIEVAKKIIQNNKEIKFDIDNIAYEDLQGIARLLGWGVIVESGNNENGSYIKFGDGTMICWVDMTVTDQAIDNPYGSFFQGTRSWTFPQAFVDMPSVTCSKFKWGSSASWGFSTGATLTTATLRGMDIGSRPTGTNCYISAMAIGRWK